MPNGAVYVGRPTIWGNSLRVGVDGDALRCVALYKLKIIGNVWTEPTPRQIQDELRGKDLVCWCPLVDKDGNRVPCHADVLLEIANSELGKPSPPAAGPKKV